MKRILRIHANKILSKFGIKIVPIYELEYLSTKYNQAVDEICSFFQETIFEPLPENDERKYFLSRLYGTQLSEAMYMIHLLQKSLNAPGDVCEFGCANGATSALLANEIKDTKKKLWLYDSFKGLSKPSSEDKLIDDIFNLGSMKQYKGTMSYSKDEVLNRLKEVKISNNKIKVISGFINEDTKLELPKIIDFAYLDMDLYIPIKTTLQQIHSRLSPGAYVIIDDYEFFSSGVKQAVDEFLEDYKLYYSLNQPIRFAGHFCILQKLN
jgi:O-methyltransferase